MAWFDYGNAFYTYYSFAAAAPWAPAARPLPGMSADALERLRTQFMRGVDAYANARSFSSTSERNPLFDVIYR